MKRIIILLLFIFLISGCGEIPNLDCIKNSDCSTAGCSSQICTTNEEAKTTITTCEFKQEYECLKLTSCECINNKCQWEQNQDYKNCLSEIKNE